MALSDIHSRIISSEMAAADMAFALRDYLRGIKLAADNNALSDAGTADIQAGGFTHLQTSEVTGGITAFDAIVTAITAQETPLAKLLAAPPQPRRFT